MKRLYAYLFTLCLFMLLPAVTLAANDRITKEELKAKMDKGDNILILDVRISGSYMDSKIKIKGAVRIDPDSIERKYQVLPKDKEIIAYCT
ncbi:MAG: hypothetical protein A2073_05510 [Deltaproteobacteria bacterium GWC2_42_11]|nr:MAG: hypothetical protein A2073_05510 [Deltaproteobacteria bacterium GWC2_42_11]HBO84877.1 hypothetical protein [Deltaproteobacteria bacterium]